MKQKNKFIQTDVVIEKLDFQIDTALLSYPFCRNLRLCPQFVEINVYASICRVTSCQRCKFSFFIGSFGSQAKIKRQFRQLPFFQLSYDMRTKQFSIFLLVIGVSINWHKRSQRYNKKSNWLELRAASICIFI